MRSFSHEWCTDSSMRCHFYYSWRKYNNCSSTLASYAWYLEYLTLFIYYLSYYNCATALIVILFNWLSLSIFLKVHLQTGRWSWCEMMSVSSGPFGLICTRQLRNACRIILPSLWLPLAMSVNWIVYYIPTCGQNDSGSQSDSQLKLRARDSLIIIPLFGQAGCAIR